MAGPLFLSTGQDLSLGDTNDRILSPLATTESGGRAVGYLRLSTVEQAASGSGRDAQRAEVSTAADRRGWAVEWIVDDGYTPRPISIALGSVSRSIC